MLQDKDYPGDLMPKHPQAGSIAGKVVHIQSPKVGDTFMEIGSSSQPLGAIASWLGVQVKPLGARPLAIEVGIVDEARVQGIIRFESWRVGCGGVG